MSKQPKEYRIKTLEDILQLDDRQRNYFIEDLRDWLKLMDNFKDISFDGIAMVGDGMIWIDDGDTGFKGVRITIDIDHKGDTND